MTPVLRLSQPVFTILGALIEERLGLFFDADYRELLADKLSPRAVELGYESLLDYYYFLRYDPAAEQELQAIADALTVNETYFMREAKQLHALVDELGRGPLAAGGRARVWCAACSTGEEPLTLASILAERGLLDRVELVASDVSSRALDFAQRGLYGGRSLRAFESIPSWLVPDGDKYRPAERLKKAIDWRRVNLLDEKAVAALGSFHAIICRNVLIYFRDDTVRVVTGLLHSALVTGGPLLVGVSESLLRLGTAFSCEEHAGAFFYRKRTL